MDVRIGFHLTAQTNAWAQDRSETISIELLADPIQILEAGVITHKQVAILWNIHSMSSLRPQTSRGRVAQAKRIPGQPGLIVDLDILDLRELLESQG
jgi:hypothetical protein